MITKVRGMLLQPYSLLEETGFSVTYAPLLDQYFVTVKHDKLTGHSYCKVFDEFPKAMAFIESIKKKREAEALADTRVAI